MALKALSRCKRFVLILGLALFASAAIPVVTPTGNVAHAQLTPKQKKVMRAFNRLCKKKTSFGALQDLLRRLDQLANLLGNLLNASIGISIDPTQCMPDFDLDFQLPNGFNPAGCFAGIQFQLPNCSFQPPNMNGALSCVQDMLDDLNINFNLNIGQIQQCIDLQADIISPEELMQILLGMAGDIRALLDALANFNVNFDPQFMIRLDNMLKLC